MKNQSRRDPPVAWTETKAAFARCKTALADATLLIHPARDAPISLQVDASDVGVGAVLQQFIRGAWQPLGFFSRSLRKPERRYSTFGRELLAMYLAIKHFRYAVEGRPLILFMDHQPLTHAIINCSDRHSPREARHIEFVAQFTTDVRPMSTLRLPGELVALTPTDHPPTPASFAAGLQRTMEALRYATPA